MELPTIDRKKLGYILGGLVGVLILLVSVTALITTARRASEKAQGPGNNSAVGINQQQKIPALPLPKVQVSQWIDKNPTPQSVTSTQLYTFKPINPEVEAPTLSQKIMGTNKIIKSKKGLLMATLESGSGEDFSAFVYNPAKGEFSYASTRGIVLPGSTKMPAADRVTGLVNALFVDPTLKITAQYKRKDKPGITYYEIHRDWNAVGLPILNPLGLLNLPENETMSKLSLTGQAGKGEDQSVYATTDASDGKARATDFNTMTVGVKDDDSSVASLISNIREIQRTQLRVANVMPYEKAIAKLRNKEYSFFYTSPSGDGVPNFDKVYPGNEGVAEQAEVKESMIAYLEEVPESDQKSLMPHYFFRGSAMLKSGYRVNFIAAVPAVDTVKTQASALGVSQQIGGSQSQSTFSITSAPGAGHCGTALTCPPSPTPGSIQPTQPPLFVTNAPPHCGTTNTCPPTPTPHCGTTNTCPPTPTPHCGTTNTCPPTPTPPGCGTHCPPTPTPHCGTTNTCPPTPTPHCGTTNTCPPTPTPHCGTTNTCPPTATPYPTNPPVTPPPGNNVCIPTVSELENSRQVSATVNIGQLTQAGFDHMRDEHFHNNEAYRVGDWFSYSNGGNLTAMDLVDSFNAAKTEGATQQRRQAFIDEDLANAPDCPIRITGGSPTLFVYGAPGQTMTITPQSTVNYAEPGLTGKAWNITTGDNGTVAVNGTVRDYLYYEYKPITFTRPSTGWTVKKENLESLITTLAQSLELNAKEEERLNFEITQAASNVSGDTLFIGLIDKQEVNTKLPLSVTPHIPVQRIHFYVGEANASVLNPHLTPLIRTSSLVLEIGAGGK